MTRRMAVGRIIFGLGLIALVYGGPYAYGLTTAADKVPSCLGQAQTPQDVVVRLGFIPGPTQIEDLQRYGRYGGSGDDSQNVVLLDVPPQNVHLLGRLYWVKRVDPTAPC